MCDENVLVSNSLSANNNHMKVVWTPNHSVDFFFCFITGNAFRRCHLRTDHARATLRFHAPAAALETLHRVGVQHNKKSRITTILMREQRADTSRAERRKLVGDRGGLRSALHLRERKRAKKKAEIGA